MNDFSKFMPLEEIDYLLSIVPDLPADFSEWVMDLFEGHHIIFYSKPDRELLLECCHCGAKRRYTFKKNDRYLPTWDGDLPGNYEDAFCPFCECGAMTVAKKNRKNVMDWDQDVWLGQKIDNGGYMLRFFRPILRTIPDAETPDEELILNEKMRIWFPKGMKKKSYKLYLHDTWNGPVWSSATCFSTMSYYRSGPTRGEIYPGTYEEMEGTVMQYSMTYEVIEESHWNLTIGEWQQAYIKNPWFEALYKMGLEELIRHKLFGYSFPRCNWRAKNPWDYLKVNKNRLEDLRDCPDRDLMSAFGLFRMEKMTGKPLGPEVITLIKAGLNEKEFKFFTEYMTPVKLRNYIEKSRKGSKKELSDVMNEYRDYLEMKKKSGYDLTDSIVLFPKDLHDAHEKAVIETNERVAGERMKKVNEQFKGIRLRFKSADKVYHYERGQFLVRPAKDAAEIVAEGRTLHHCVGGDEYLSSHEKKQSIICFLRRKAEPDTPYITIEINPDCTIEQWYGVNDSKPDKKKIDRWLRTYMKTRDPKKILNESKRKSVKKAV